MLVSGIFCLLIAILLLLYFWQLKQHEPLESKTIEALVERLAADPGNEELMNEIREFDLLVRKAYFTGSWQVKSGAWLLLFGGILFVAALRIHTGLQKQIEPPEESGDKGMHAKWVTHRWLLASGFLVIALALVSAFLSHDHLKKYDPLMAAGGAAGAQETEVPVIRITDSTEGIQLTGEDNRSIPGVQDSGPDAAGGRTGAGIREEQLAEGERLCRQGISGQRIIKETRIPSGDFSVRAFPFIRIYQPNGTGPAATMSDGRWPSQNRDTILRSSGEIRFSLPEPTSKPGSLPAMTAIQDCSYGKNRQMVFLAVRPLCRGSARIPGFPLLPWLWTDSGSMRSLPQAT